MPTAGRWAVRERLKFAWAVARKDLLLEFRTRTAIISAVVFTALVLTVFNFGRDPTAVPTIDLAPSILWVTFTFAAMLALNRAFELELENEALEGLLVSPISRTSLYWGKLLANLVFVAVVEAVGLPLFVLFFDVPVWHVLLPLVGVIALATVGFVAVGTLFSAMVIRTRFAELMLPVLLLPFLILPVAWAVQVTAKLLAGRPIAEALGWLKLLGAYDIVFVTLSTLLFPHTVDE
jgi:heme exporter protein B